MAERVRFAPEELRGGLYPLINSLVVPRPIAWVGSRSAAGVDNLAPHSYFTVASVFPPVLAFTSVGPKDTLGNITETLDFTVCIGTRAMAEAMNVTGTDYPPEHSEFAAAGLTAEPAGLVQAPSVAGAPAIFECRLVDTRTFGTGSLASTVIFGSVLAIAVDPAVLDADGGAADPELLAPVARLGADHWAGLGEIFDLRRVPYAEVRD